MCHCHGVNDDEIGAEIDAGARTVDEIGARCGAGTGCGGCRPVVEAVLATHLAHHDELSRDGRLAEHLGHEPSAPAPATPDPSFVRSRRA
ncbi:MAG TPA: (2Fe-2S)-binding protein [Acidimicrobiales bacterium]|nr:(2Fe-2S)-binding protein [Acidimicrobiales bacterium]